MEFVTVFGFGLVALGVGVALLSSGSPAEAGRWGGSTGLPARLIGSGALFLGMAATVWMMRNAGDLLAAPSIEFRAVALGLAPVGLGALVVGLSGELAAPGMGEWRWALLVSLLPGLVAGFLWAAYLLAPGHRTLAMFALEGGPEAGELDGLLRSVLGVVTAYPVVALVGAVAGGVMVRELGGHRPGASGTDTADPGEAERMRGEDRSAEGLGPLVGERAVTRLRFTSVGGSWCQRVYDGDEEVAFLELDPLARKGGFELSGMYYKVVSDVLGRSYTLRWRGGPLAVAKIASLGRHFRIAVGERELLLRPRFGLIPGLGEFHVEEAGGRVGWVAPRPVHPEGGVAVLPDDVPLPVRLFIIHLTVLLRLRWSKGRSA